MSGEKLRGGKPGRIAVDRDNPEWTKADFARARPASKVLGVDAAALLVRGRGRPAKAPGERKQQVTLRLAPDVLGAARASGRGWQVRAEAALRREFMDDPIVARAPLTGRFVSLHQAMKEAAKSVNAARVSKSVSSIKSGEVIRPGKLLRGKAAKPDGGKKRA